MRPQRIDITGKTDGSGNATIPVKLPQTGEWFDLKFPLSTTGAAEWAILSSGTPLTYGRGRRVTLGPELIQDGERITISVINGPVNAAIIGSANGRSGDPDQILAGFSPSPNTIALDTTTQRLPLYPDGTPDAQKGAAPTFPSFTVGASGSATKTFTILPTQTNLRIMVVGSSNYRANVAGHQTGEGYLTSTLVVGFPTTALTPLRPIDVRVEPSWDPQVDITITDNSGIASNVYVSALFGAETTFIAASQAPLPVYNPNNAAALWQAPTLTAAGGVGTLVASVAGQDIYLFGWCCEIDETTGSTISTLTGVTELARGLAFGASAGAVATGYHGGLKVPSGNSLVVARPVGTGNVAWSVSYNQG